MNKTIRTILTVLFVATLLFSAAYALDSTEQDFLSFFFDDRQLDALQDYQNKYTANEFLALKLTGQLPQLPDAQPIAEPEPVVEEKEQPIVADEITPSLMEQSFLNEEDKLIAAEAVVDVVE